MMLWRLHSASWRSEDRLWQPAAAGNSASAGGSRFVVACKGREHMETSGWVYSIWAGISLLAVTTVAVALFSGYRGIGTPILWRKIKLAASLSGLCSIAFLMITFDALARRTFVERPLDGRMYANTQLRFIVLSKLAATCSPSSQDRACLQLRELDSKLSRFIWVGEMARLDVTKYDPGLDSLVGEVNLIIDMAGLNTAAPIYIATSSQGRLGLFFTGAILLVLAVAGSVGEAAFQLNQENAKIGHSPASQSAPV